MSIKKFSYHMKRVVFISRSLTQYFLFKTKIRLLNQRYDKDSLVNFAFGKCPLIRPFQVRYEILRLLTILNEIKPKSILEIGTERGGTLFLFSRIAPEDATIISIDLHGGRFGGGYPSWRIPIYKSFAKGNQKIHLIREDSHDRRTLEKAKSILNGKELNLLFIDGDHSYEGVKRDFEMYSPLVKEDGIIALHDIAPPSLENDSEVSKFWAEIKSAHNYMEIVKDWNQKWAGIGLIRKAKAQAFPLSKEADSLITDNAL